MKRKKIKIVFTALNRTILRDDNTFSERSLQVLENLQKKGIIIVIATRRNIFSASKGLPDDLPINYLMISSGCGTIDWKTKDVIYENHLNRVEIKRVFDIFIVKRNQLVVE